MNTIDLASPKLAYGWVKRRFRFPQCVDDSPFMIFPVCFSNCDGETRSDFGSLAFAADRTIYIGMSNAQLL